MAVVWILHHYAQSPEGQWTASHDMARALVERGHRVTIFASSFDHYTRRETCLRRGQLTVERTFEGVRFLFLKGAAYHRNDWRRVLNIVQYAGLAFWKGWRDRERPDVIIGSTPHPLTPLVAWLLSRLRAARFFFEVRDLWPQFLVEAGLMSPTSPAVPVLRWIEGFCFRRAHMILTVWPGMARYITSRGIPESRILWNPIGLDVSRLIEPGPGERAAERPFICMYRGGFGYSNSPTTILDAAEILRRRGISGIKFVLAGEGPAKADLLRDAERRGLDNVEFQGFVPKRELPRAMAEADAFVCSLPDVPHFEQYGQIPTKLVDYLSAGRPIVLTSAGGSTLVRVAGAGIVVPPGDAQALADGITQVAALGEEERRTMGRNGVNYVKTHHDIAALARRLESALQQATA